MPELKYVTVNQLPYVSNGTDLFIAAQIESHEVGDFGIAITLKGSKEMTMYPWHRVVNIVYSTEEN